MDVIRIEGLEIYAHHGVLPEEKEAGQTFYVSCEMEVSIREAGRTDDLEKTVNYAEVAHLINEVMTSNTWDLIETCAEQVAEAVLLSNKLIRGVWVQISKPSAPIGLPFDTVCVECERRWHEVYIALGSNMGDSKALIEEAVRKLDEEKLIRVEKVSTLVRTKPYGVTDQPDFLNGAAKLMTVLSPHELLEELHRIEAEAGRERVIHWGPRTLDLDILLYEDLVLGDDDLCIPHADMLNRDFVLNPMKEIAPYAVHPLAGKRMVEL